MHQTSICSACGAMVSASAKRCHNCGAPLRRGAPTWLTAVAAAVVGILLILIVIELSSAGMFS